MQLKKCHYDPYQAFGVAWLPRLLWSTVLAVRNKITRGPATLRATHERVLGAAAKHQPTKII
jgi:hypothetical protein